MFISIIIVILLSEYVNLSYSFHIKPQHQCYHGISQSLNTLKQPGLLLHQNNIETLIQSKLTHVGSLRVLPPSSLTDIWKFWFTGRDNSFLNEDYDLPNIPTGNVYHATSLDGLTSWEHHSSSPVLKPGKTSGDWFWFDSEFIGLGDVIVPGNDAQSKFLSTNSVFLMYTYGGNSDKQVIDDRTIKGLNMNIGVAVSQDGIHWSKVEGLSPYCSIVDKGSINEFDGSFVSSPSILELKDEFRMYYHTYDTMAKKFKIGVAVARDGLLNWRKVGGSVFEGSVNENHFDYMGATTRHIVRLRDGTFRMWYEGIGIPYSVLTEVC